MSYSLMTVETLGWMLIHSLWIIAAIAVLASVTMLLLRRRSANARYLVGCAALLLSAASLPISLVFLVEQVAVVQHEDATALRGSISVSRSKEITAPDGTEVSISWDEQLTLPIKELDQHLTNQTAPTSTPSVDRPFVERVRDFLQPHLSKIVTGWFIGIVLLSIRPLVGWRHARRLRSTGIVDVSDEVQRLFASLMHRISMTRAVQLFESQLVQIPSVVGAFKPVILLPATAMTGLTPDQLQAVLAHELAHIRRHDYLINGLQTAIETLLFYHPAIWWLSRRVRIERENCCDDFVVSLLDNSAEYCRALVRIDQLRQHSPLPAMALHATDGSLLARVRRLAGVESPSRFSNSPAIVLLAFVVVGTMLAWSLSYAQKEEAPPLPEEAATIEEETSSSADELHEKEVPPDPLPESATAKSVAKVVLAFARDESRRAIQGLMVKDKSTTLIISAIPAVSVPDGAPAAIDRTFLELDGKPLIRADVEDDAWNWELFAMRAQGEYAALEMPEITTVDVGDSLSAESYGFVNGMQINHDAVKVKSLNVSTDHYFLHALKKVSYDNLIQVDGVLREGTMLFKEGKLAGIVLIGERYVDDNADPADDKTSYAIPADRVTQFITDVREKRVHRDPEPKPQNDLKLGGWIEVEPDPLPPPASPTEKSTAKLVLGFWQDESRRAIQSLLIAHNGKTIVISASPASIVPDGSRPAIDASFLEFDEKPPIPAEYRDGNIELQYHLADGGFTGLEMPEIADVKPNDSLSALTYDFVNGMRVQPNATSVYNTNASFQLPSPHVKHYKNLISVKGALREGTILFKDGKLAGIVLAGRRLNKMQNDTLEGKESYVVPASHVLALIEEAKAKIDGDDAKKKNAEPKSPQVTSEVAPPMPKEATLKTVEATPDPLPQSPTEKSTAKLVLGFHDDVSRRAIQALMTKIGGQTFVLSAASAEMAPDGAAPVISRAFLETNERPPVALDYFAGTLELSLRRVDGEYTSLESPDVAKVKIGDSLSTLTYGWTSGMRIKSDAATVVSNTASFEVTYPTLKEPVNYENLIQVRGLLREGTILFKEGKLAGIVLIGKRYVVQDEDTSNDDTSYVVPAHRVAAMIEEAKAKIDGDDAKKKNAEPKGFDETSEPHPPAAVKPPAARAAQYQPLMPRISVVDADSPYDEAAEVNSFGVPNESDVKQVARSVQDFALLKLPERVAGEVVDKVTGKRVEGATVTFRFYLGSDTDRANADATFTFRDVGQFEFDIPEKFRPNANNEGSAPPLIRCTVERIVEHPDYQPLERSTMSFGRLAQITMADYVSRWFQRIELTPGVEVTGQVLDFDRRPAKGIRVFSGRNRAGWQNGCVHETFTDADGRYRLIVPKKHGPGRIYVVPDHASAVSRAITPEFGEQEVFQLRRGTRLHGRVLDEKGEGVPGIVVRANGGERIPWRYTVTNDKGEYLTPPLQYGTYDVELIDQGQIPDSAHVGSRLFFVYVNQKLTLPKDAPVEQRLDFPPVEKVTVTARCTNSDGSPVTGSTFSIYGTANTTHWRGTLTDVPGEPGTYSVRVPKGIQQLRVEHVGGRYFYRITRHSQNGAEPLGNWFVQVDEDDDSLRIERWNAATIRVRTLVDGKRFDVVSGHGGLHWPRFADVEHARKLGGEAATSIMLNSPDDRGFWQTDVHPEIDVVLKIDAPGFAPWSKTVRLEEGEIREIDVPLERIVDRSVERRVTP